jgi:hypothetical protein
MKKVLTIDKFLSIWIFIYTIAYFLKIVPYNPIILISIALIYFIGSLFIIIPRSNERSLLTYYITINVIGKAIPFILIFNNKITYDDIVFTLYFILAYIIYMQVFEEDIICAYREYVEFIIDRDSCSEGALYHYMMQIQKYFTQAETTAVEA